MDNDLHLLNDVREIVGAGDRRNGQLTDSDGQ
jgi:hypothetical protein